MRRIRRACSRNSTTVLRSSKFRTHALLGRPIWRSTSGFFSATKIYAPGQHRAAGAIPRVRGEPHAMTQRAQCVVHTHEARERARPARFLCAHTETEAPFLCARPCERRLGTFSWPAAAFCTRGYHLNTPICGFRSRSRPGSALFSFLTRIRILSRCRAVGSLGPETRNGEGTIRPKRWRVC